MRDFFKPWRRKLGVMALGLACVVAAGWVRSLHVSDEFVFRRGRSYDRLLLLDGTIGWGSWSADTKRACMCAKDQKTIVPAPTLWSIRVLAAVLTGVPSMIGYLDSGMSAFRGLQMKVFGFLFVASVVSVIMRFGPIIPCMVVGSVLGLMIDPAVRGGDIESQTWETVGLITFGGLCGFIAGSSPLLIGRMRGPSKDASDA